MRILAVLIVFVISAAGFEMLMFSSDFEKGIKYFRKKDYKKAIGYFEKVVKKGESDPKYFSIFDGDKKNVYGFVCSIYWDGSSVKKDYKKALEICKKGAKVDDSLALYILGLAYEEGLGVEKNYKMSVKWYEKGAKVGHLYCMNSAGLIYEYGRGDVPMNKVKAYKYWKKCASSDNPNFAKIIATCQKNLGRICKSDPWLCQR